MTGVYPQSAPVTQTVSPKAFMLLQECNSIPYFISERHVITSREPSDAILGTPRQLYESS
eukprot:7516289-Pyramimonas_sp.AAC.1